MRNPNPSSAERLATGAGDLATGVVSLMRAFSALSGSRPRPARRPDPAGRSNPAGSPERAARPAPPAPDVAWSAATRAGVTTDRDDPAPARDESPWAAATHAAAREQQAAARARAEAALREKAEAAREQAAAARARAEAARRRVEEAAAAARRAEGTPAGTVGARTGQDVWAAATADRGDVGAQADSGVGHDVAGDDTRPGGSKA
jgi:type IV secretory pathway VirB10-like protein